MVKCLVDLGLFDTTALSVGPVTMGSELDLVIRCGQ